MTLPFEKVLVGTCHNSAIREGSKTSKDPFALPGAKVHYPPDRNYDVQHLKLEIELDIEKKTVQGRATLTFTPLANGFRTMHVDAVDMSIKSVKDASGSELDFDYTGKKVQVYFSHFLKVGEKATLSIEYSASPRKGLYFVGPDKGYSTKPVQVWTHGEPEDGRYWFPCYDYPNDRLTSEVLVTVPAKFQAISNGKLLDIAGNKEEGTKTYHWLQEVPHVTYLISIVVGEFVEFRTEWQGIPLTYLVPKDRERDALRSFEKTPKMMQFFSDVTGLKYAYPKYAQVAVADFIVGAEENTSATTFTQEILHDERAHLDYNSDGIVSHELAHQWFGDLVTCKDWAHIWLNEGFATYFEALFKEHDLGRDEFHARLLDYYEEYLEEVKEKYRRPIVARVYHDPDELFDRHTYEKGALVLNTLRFTLGDDQFWKVIKTYVAKFQDKVVEVADFKTTIEEVTGKKMDQFFDQWLFKPGHPELTFKIDWKDQEKLLELSIEQTQDISDGTPIFQFQAEVLVVDEVGEDRLKVDIAERSHVFRIPLERKPLSAVFDPENWILKTVKFEKAQKMLLHELKHGKSIMTRIWAARTLANFPNSDVIQALKESMHNDSFWAVQGESAKALGTIGSDAALDALAEGVKVRHPKARRAVVKALGEIKNERAADVLLKVLSKDESYSVEAEAAKSLGKTKSARAFDALTSAFRTKESHREIIRVNVLEGLGELKDPRAIPTLVQATKYGQYFRIRQTAAKTLGKLGQYDKTVIDHLVDLLKDVNYYVRAAAAEGLEELRDPKALDALELVVERDIQARVRRAARHAIYKIREQLEKNVEWRKLQDDVAQLKQENRRLQERIERLEAQLAGTKDPELKKN